MDAGKPTGSTDSNEKLRMALAVVVAVGALAVAATTGDSWAVRLTLVLVAGDVSVRLWRR